MADRGGRGGSVSMDGGGRGGVSVRPVARGSHLGMEKRSHVVRPDFARVLSFPLLHFLPPSLLGRSVKLSHEGPGARAISLAASLSTTAFVSSHSAARVRSCVLETLLVVLPSSAFRLPSSSPTL